MGPRAVSQLLWSGKDREEWFSLRENHGKVCRFDLHQLRNCPSPEHPGLKSETWATHSIFIGRILPVTVSSIGQTQVSTEVHGVPKEHFRKLLWPGRDREEWF